MAHDPPRFLLLLPPPPSPPSHSSLKAAFASTVSQVLKEVATHSAESTRAAVLEIALACPHLVGKRKAARSSLYASTQSLLAGVYKLVCTVAANEGINVEDADGVDVRVLLIAWAPGQDPAPTDADDYPFSPVGTLHSLAQSGRQWQYAFGCESDAGESMIKAFVQAKGASKDVTRVETGPETQRDTTSAAPGETGKLWSSSHPGAEIHHHVAVGGTFDHIHIGHKLLLTMTLFAVDEDVTSSSHERSATIGITGDELLKSKKHPEVLESWEDRYRAVMTFVNAIIDYSPPSSTGQRHISIRDDPGPNGKSMDVSYPNGLVVKCTEIQDPFGPTITVEQISALIISAETRSGGKAVNDKRSEKGWKPLEVFEVDVLDAGEDAGAGAVQGFESKLSSTAIREKLVKKRQSSL